MIPLMIGILNTNLSFTGRPLSVLNSQRSVAMNVQNTLNGMYHSVLEQRRYEEPGGVSTAADS